jgi:protein-tyrosine phosphatase
MIDLHFATPQLAVGASFPEEAASRLAREHRIRRVVDLRLEARDDEVALGRHGIRLLHLPTEDCCAISGRAIRQGVTFAREGLEQGERVLIHCQYGIGRSALLALCVLVDGGEEPLDAMARLKVSRPVISPSPEQLRAFLAYCADRLRDGAATGPLPSLEDLGDIAWCQQGPDVDLERARAASTRRR